MKLIFHFSNKIQQQQYTSVIQQRVYANLSPTQETVSNRNSAQEKNR